jgi:ABC-type antimicrobial peptide transport system permease subunit
MQEYLTRAGSKRGFVAQLLAIFAGAALLLAAGGFYALVSLSNAQRTREFGVRLALGATRASVASMVLRQGVMLAASGTAAGVVGIVVLSRWFGSMLFEVSPADPIAIGGAALILVSAAVGACVVPMRRAMRSDPIECLRSE